MIEGDGAVILIFARRGPGRRQREKREEKRRRVKEKRREKKAAERAYLELSAASKALSRLEQTLGFALVDRLVRPMWLTPDALALLPQVRRLVAAQEDIVSKARRLHHPAGAIIRVSLSAGSFNAKKVEAFREYEAAHSPNGGKLHIEAVID